MSAYMQAQQARAERILASFAAGVNHAVTREDQLRAVIAITNEVERHVSATDPRETTAVSVALDLIVELAQGMRHLANVMIKDDQPVARDYPTESEWPASIMDAGALS